MNDPIEDIDQADEDILISTVSDEVLEAAAGTGRGWANDSGDTACFFQPSVVRHCC
jgi:hypothetical protein